MRLSLLFVVCSALVGCEGGKADTAGGETGTDSGTDSGGDSGTDSGGDTACPPYAIVSDIDETLTTSDSEYIQQIADPDYDPAMRPDADTLMQGYAALGYRVFYVTGRGDDLPLSDGTPAMTATSDWLDLHGFPRSEGDLYLADGVLVLGDDLVAYKTGVIDTLQAGGTTFSYAYGNADTDIEAFRGAGIPDDDIFLVGALAGTIAGVNDITNDDAYTNHISSWMPSVPEAPCGG